MDAHSLSPRAGLLHGAWCGLRAKLDMGLIRAADPGLLTANVDRFLRCQLRAGSVGALWAATRVPTACQHLGRYFFDSGAERWMGARACAGAP